MSDFREKNKSWELFANATKRKISTQKRLWILVAEESPLRLVREGVGLSTSSATYHFLTFAFSCIKQGQYLSHLPSYQDIV